jgi:PAS domain S-box-containing protein
MLQPNATSQDTAAAERADLADVRLRLALAMADLGAWDWELATNRVVWDDVHARLCGYAPGECGGDAAEFLELVHPDDRDALAAAVERAKHADEEFVHTYRLRRRGDGALRWMNGRGIAFRDAAGVPRRLTGILADVTEAHEQAEALRAQEARFHAAFENAGTAKLLVAPGGRILEANGAAAVMLGYTGVSLAALSFQQLVDAEEVGRGRDPLALLASRRRGEYRGEHRFVCRNGRRLVCDTAITTVAGAAGAAAFHAVELRDVTEQRRALDALRLSEQRVALTLASTEDVLWDWRVQTGEVFFGEQLARILGVDPGRIEPTVESWRRLVHPDDYAAVAAALAAHVDGQAARYGAEYRLRAAGDAWVWVLDRGMVVERDRDGRALRALGMMRDISDRKRAELALRASQERYALIAHGTLDALWDWDVPSDSMFVSPSTEAMLGHPPGGLTGTKATEWSLHVHPEDLPRVQASIQSHLERRTPHDLEFRLRHRDGHYLWFRGRGQAVWDADGRPLRMAGALADVTARRAAEEASAASEARFRALLDAAPFGLALLDGARHCNYTNARLLGILGRSREDVLGGGWLDAIDAGARAALLERLAAYRAGARWGEPLELPLRAEPGAEVRWVAVRAEPLPGADGAPAGDLLVFDDVTAQRRLAAQLEHAVRPAAAPGPER